MTADCPYDFMDPALMADPFEADEWARNNAPVWQAPGTATYVVFSYDLIDEVLGNPGLYSSRNEEMMLGRSVHDADCQAIYADGWPQAETLLNNDPPSHTRFRKLVRKAFSPGRIRDMDERIRRVINELIDAFIDAGQCEFVAAYAMPLPALVIAEQMGIPPADIHRVKAWSNAFIELIGSYLPHERELAEARRVVEFQHYLKARIDERRVAPRDDMLSALVHATDDDEAPLTDAEILNVAQQIIVAGNTTTTHMLAAGVYYLMRHPGSVDRLRDDPAMLPRLVEELLRLETPTYSMWRKAVADTSLGGVAIPAGSQLILRFGSANRDATYFPDPHKLDIDRRYVRQHMAFSKGIHTCIGAALARAELVASFEILFDRLINVRLADGAPEPSYLPNLQLRGVDSLTIAFDRAV